MRRAEIGDLTVCSNVEKNIVVLIFFLTLHHTCTVGVKNPPSVQTHAIVVLADLQG
jgi:hypothetical protein